MLDGEDMLNWWQRNAGGDVTGTRSVSTASQSFKR
jgi:hypothetical protein